MPRRLALVALWAVFAVASVSVGFGAASLVSDPFTDVNTSAAVDDVADPDGSALTGPAAGSTDQASESAAPATNKPDSQTTTVPPAGSGATRTAGPTKAPGAASPAIVKRGFPTRGGYVSATCRGHLVSVGAAPALSWRVASWTPGQRLSARVSLEPAQNAHGEEIEVTATCPNGTPVFASDDHGASGGGGDDGDGGDGGGGGGDGSGGSDGSSGTGDG